MKAQYSIYKSIEDYTPLQKPPVKSAYPSLDALKELMTSPAMCEIIRRVRDEKDDDKRKALKKKLPAIRPSVGPWYSETYKNTRKGTGIFQIDVDHLQLKESYDRIKDTLINTKGIQVVFRSPSGDGIKALAKLFDVDELRKTMSLKEAQEYIYAHHEEAFAALRKLLAEKGIECTDASVKDPGRALYLSYDPDVYISDDLSSRIEWEEYKPKKRIGSHIVPVHKEDSALDISEVLDQAVRKIKEAQEGSRNSECFRQGSIIAKRLSESKLSEDLVALHKQKILDAIEIISESRDEIEELKKAFTRGLKYSDSKESDKNVEAPAKGTVERQELQGALAIDTVEAYFSGTEKVSLGIFPTGTGKSYASISKALEIAKNGGKVLLLVANKLAIEDTVKKLLKADRSVAFETCQEENASPSKHAKIVISHHYYLRSRGCSNFSFPLYQWVDDNTTVIIDEVDSLSSVLHTSIPVVGAKLVQGENGDVENVALQCPSRTTKSFRCHTCKKACPTLKWKISNTVPELILKSRKKDELPPHEIDISDCLEDGFDSAKVVHSTKLITMSRRVYRNVQLDTELKSGVPTNSDEISLWIRDSIASAGYAYTLETQDVREVLQTAYADALQQALKAGSKTPGKEASKKVRKLQEEGALPKFPYYPCGTKTLSMLDTKVMSYICHTAKQTFMLTATLTEAERYALNTAHSFNVYKSTEGRKVIEKSLVITTPLCIKDFVKDEEKWKDTIRFEKLAEDVTVAKKVAKKKESTGLVFWHADTDDMPSWTGDARKEHSSCIAYARSAIARGANLPMFKTVTVNFQAYKPSIAYALAGVATLETLILEEKVSLMMQQLGRILRVEEGETDARRVLVIENCVDESGKDLSASVNELVSKEIEKMSMSVDTKVIDSTTIVHEGHHESIIQTLAKDYMSIGTVTKNVELLTLDFTVLLGKGRNYKSACVTFPALKTICSEEQWAEKWWRRYTIIIKKAHDEGLRGKTLKDRVSFYRARKMCAMPASLHEEIETLVS